MGFFKRMTQPPGDRGQATIPPMGSGRRLRSSRSPGACLNDIEGLVDSYRPRKYEHLPAYDVTGFTWRGEGPAPDAVVSFQDASDDFILVTLWGTESGTDLGLFPLGSGDDRLDTLPVIGNWKMRDPSLSSTGLIPGGQIVLAAPRIPPDFVAESLALAGAPPTPRNIDVMGRKLGELVMIKALQFISAQDQRASDRFADAHRYTGGSIEAYLQLVADDLVALNPGLSPYVQSIATRGRAVLLDALSERPDTLPLER